MFVSKRLLPIAVLITLAAGCKPQSTVDGVNGPNRVDASPGATFFVYDGDGDGRVGQVISGSKWPVPMTANFSFVACMKDRASAAVARGQKFEVEIPETGQRIIPDSPSSETGCITWQEAIPFNYYAKQSAPIQIVRHIVGVGVHTGYFVVRYAVDPWAVGDQARDMIKPVQYLKKVAPPPNLVTDIHKAEHALSGDDNGGATLWISKLDFNVLDRQDFAGSSKLDYQIKMNPFVEWINNDGIPGFKKLDNGEFEVFAQLVATDTGPKQDQKVILTTKQMETFATVKNGELLATLSTTLARAVSIGNIVLVVRLVPVGIGGSRLLNSYEGIYELGDIHKMSDAQLAQSCLDHSDICNYDKFLQGADNFAALEQTDKTPYNYAFANDRFSFSSLKLRFVTVATTPAETATQRTVSYSATTCVTDRRTGSRMTKTPFHIEYLSDDGKSASTNDPYQSQNLITDDEGCLHWLANQSHQYYMQEHFYAKKVHIVMGGTEAGTILKFRLNPWDDKFTFGFDDRELSPDFIEANSDPKDKPESRFFTGGYGYHTIRFQYSFDEYMSLQVKKTILLEVDPRVLRYSGIVNARKTTEGLRDGIYLMKVAIQKNYLDATTAGLKILGDPREQNHVRAKMDPSRDDPKFKEIRRRDYVTTSEQLVRVVDGRLIKPVELTMVDLRLMRMRTNFLIELETVDEQLVSANQVFQDEYDKEIKAYRETFSTGKENENLDRAQRQEKIDGRAAETQKKLKDAWDQLTQFLAAKRNNLKENQNKDIHLSDYAIPDDIAGPIGTILKVNDFTRTKLPSCDDTDCERFVETESGLKPRTFVGPMIFLSNSYSDAVRPTDNLDEACNRPDNPYEAGVGGEEDWLGQREKAEEQSRRNKWYVYSKYYGAMTYLCNKSVDDLMAVERRQQKNFKTTMTKLSSLENFVESQNSDFAILSEANAKEYTASENLLSTSHLMELLNGRTYYEPNSTPPLPQRSVNDLTPLFFGTQAFDIKKEQSVELSNDQLLGLCNVLTNRLSEEMAKFHANYSGSAVNNFFSKRFGRNAPFADPALFLNAIYHRCMNRGRDSIFIDSRLRVIKTGSDYTFKGGLQMNLNVGESFSASAGESVGKAASFDAVDMTTSVVGVGALLATRGALGAGALATLLKGFTGAVMIHALKPLSGRVSDSTSAGTNEGTSISSQTYLVSQIAKFDVEIEQYELCRTYRLDKSVLGADIWLDYGHIDLDFPDQDGRPFKQALDRGITVCQGKPMGQGLPVDQGTAVGTSVHVPEDYFYFTQHFTEGDMLDQSDLLNNPWLLQLRGDRDFVFFLNTIKAKEAVNTNSLEYGLGTDPALRPVDWPLQHLAETYSQTAPSHPGFYTILPPMITQFPVNNQTINLKEDVNGELCSDPKGCENMPIQSSPPNIQHTNSPGSSSDQP